MSAGRREPRRRTAGSSARRRPRVETSPGESIRIERVICVARLFLAIIALISLNFIEPQTDAYGSIARVLLLLFAAHSLAALLVVRRRPRRAKAFALVTHSIDLVAAVLTLPMASATNPFFAFFLFVLASAAFRWGIRETVATTAVAIVFMLLHKTIGDLVPALAAGAYDDPGRVIVRTAYLSMMGLVLGYLAEEGRVLRAETAAVARLLGKIRVDVNVTRALTAVGNDTVEIFGATHLMLVVEELASQRVFRWDTVGGWSLASATGWSEAPVVDRSVYFFGSADHSMAITRRRWPRSSYETIALNPAGRLVDGAHAAVPEAFAATHPFRRVILSPVAFGDEWIGRIFIFEPRLNVHMIELIEFLQTLIRQVSPAVYSVHLQNRLHVRASALERARVARELHDGVIQSLVGVEMQIEVLSGQEALRNTPAGRELVRLQNLVRDEVLNLRDLMQQMRPAEFDPDELLDHLADMVQRFGRDSGIQARFGTDLREVTLARQICFELVRIVQEALTNIRRHSAARHVVVRFGVAGGSWRLEIDDDGRGFPFEGRLSLAELDSRGEGPVIIKERVRAIGGEMAITSRPGRGSRMEVLVPKEGHG